MGEILKVCSYISIPPGVCVTTVDSNAVNWLSGIAQVFEAKYNNLIRTI